MKTIAIILCIIIIFQSLWIIDLIRQRDNCGKAYIKLVDGINETSIVEPCGRVTGSHSSMDFTISPSDTVRITGNTINGVESESSVHYMNKTIFIPAGNIVTTDQLDSLLKLCKAGETIIFKSEK